MPRYWVIAPVESTNAELPGDLPADLFDKVWKFDLAKGVISIGWEKVGDVSKMSYDELSKSVAKAYPRKRTQARGLIRNMLWRFWKEIRLGDVVIARRGQKVLAGVGKVVRTAYWAPGTNPDLASRSYSHHGFIGVKWQEQPRDKEFSNVVFFRQTLKETSEADYSYFVNGPTQANAIDDLGTDTRDRAKKVVCTYARNEKVRDAARRRAKGTCEFCGRPGFIKPDGTRYLEAHHIIALADDGEDRPTNVIALCPNDHREAHFGKRAKEIEKEMQQKLETITKSMNGPKAATA